MPCYSPLQAYFACSDSGSRKVKFSSHAAKSFFDGDKLSDDYFGLPCGKCIGCRLERSRQWAVRLMHEASLYEDNCFITLTYSDEHLPKDGSLNKKHFQDFMKRLRFSVRPKVGFPESISMSSDQKRLYSKAVLEPFEFPKIRYYHCGEYGEQFQRPHYHVCLFNYDFADKTHFKTTDTGKLYTSSSLDRLWGFGHCLIGDLTFESAAYVARYCTKLITGDMAKDHYQGRQPEYATMSRRPGIGADWFDKYWKDAFPSDYLVVNGSKCSTPRFYDNRFAERFPSDFEVIKSKRVLRSKVSENDNTYRRLKDREKCQLVRMKQLKRTLENVK